MNKKLITIPNKLLREKSKRIGYVDDSILALVDQMSRITKNYDKDSELGVALAAIQVGEPLRLTVIRDTDEKGAQDAFTTFINPEIVKRSDQQVSDLEGCLSIPNIYGRISRSKKIKVRALDVSGNPIRVSAEGFLARVFQHEIDHMNGILFLDYIEGEQDLYELAKDGGLQKLKNIPPKLKSYLS